MSPNLECRLPPITALSLDFPLLLPQPYSNAPPRHFHGLSSPQMAACGGVPGGYANHNFASQPAVMGAYNSPAMPLPSTYSSLVSPSPPGFHSHHGHVGLAEYTLRNMDSAVSPGYQETRHMPIKQMPEPLVQQPSPTSSRRSSHLSASESVLSPQTSVSSESETTVYSSAQASKTTEGSKEMKRRKKRQCPECHLYFSNLATHKSTHLNPTSRPHVCTVCSRGFARPNDLFRHQKCHWKETGTGNGQFTCPFKTSSPDSQCSHTLGVFSRCDTYKNHLKAIHFDYPGGTRKCDRATSAGRCGLCQKQFLNVDEWLSTHVETHLCKYMK